MSEKRMEKGFGVDEMVRFFEDGEEGRMIQSKRVDEEAADWA
jgi:hypothetical protein